MFATRAWFFGFPRDVCSVAYCSIFVKNSPTAPNGSQTTARSGDESVPGVTLSSFAPEVSRLCTASLYPGSSDQLSTDSAKPSAANRELTSATLARAASRADSSSSDSRAAWPSRSLINLVGFAARLLAPYMPGPRQPTGRLCEGVAYGRDARVGPQPRRAVRRSSRDTTRPAVLTDALPSRIARLAADSAARTSSAWLSSLT